MANSPSPQPWTPGPLNPDALPDLYEACNEALSLLIDLLPDAEVTHGKLVAALRKAEGKT